MELIVLLSDKEENLPQLKGVIEKQEWDNILILSTSNQKIETNKSHEIIQINPNQTIEQMKTEIAEKLKPKIKSLEVSLTIASGTGKEHMALISALISIPVGIKFVAFTSKGVIEL